MSSMRDHQEEIITVVIRNANRDLLDHANAALLAAGFDSFFSELQTTAQYEADTRPSLTIVPPGAHRRAQTSPVTINITGPSRQARFRSGLCARPPSQPRWGMSRLPCDVCGLVDPYNGQGDGIGSCACPRCDCGNASGSSLCVCPTEDDGPACWALQPGGSARCGLDVDHEGEHHFNIWNPQENE